MPCRKIPYQHIDPLKKELQKMVKDKIITPITLPTEFVNPIVIVKKHNNQIRICPDPKKLNAALCREHFNLPTFDEITHDMAGAK